MFDWIVIGVLYVCGIAFFRLIGGLGSAADGLRKWGGAYAERQRAQPVANHPVVASPSARRRSLSARSVAPFELLSRLDTLSLIGYG